LARPRSPSWEFAAAQPEIEELEEELQIAKRRSRQVGETAQQMQVGAGDNGAHRRRTALAGERHAAAPSQNYLVRKVRPGIRVESV